MTTKFKDRDILNAMQREADKDAMVYGANAHYSVGAYYSVIGNKYNKQQNITDAENTKAAQNYMTETDEEKLAKGLI